MTKSDYLELTRETLADVEYMIKKKNHDYTGGSTDPFSNFRMSMIEGVPAETGLLIRIQDKFQRIRTFLSRGTLEVDGEGIDDAIHDIIGYMLVLKGLIHEQQQEDLND